MVKHRQVRRTKERAYFYRGKEETRGAVLKRDLLEERRLQVVLAFHWLSVLISHWLGCCWARRKISFPPAGVVK